MTNSIKATKWKMRAHDKQVQNIDGHTSKQIRLVD